MQWEVGVSKVRSDSKCSDAKSGESPPRPNQDQPRFRDSEREHKLSHFPVCTKIYLHALILCGNVELAQTTFLIKLSYYH